MKPGPLDSVIIYGASGGYVASLALHISALSRAGIPYDALTLALTVLGLPLWLAALVRHPHVQRSDITYRIRIVDGMRACPSWMSALLLLTVLYGVVIHFAIPAVRGQADFVGWREATSLSAGLMTFSAVAVSLAVSRIRLLEKMRRAGGDLWAPQNDPFL